MYRRVGTAPVAALAQDGPSDAQLLEQRATAAEAQVGYLRLLVAQLSADAEAREATLIAWLQAAQKK
jgi:hypothetical protein